MAAGLGQRGKEGFHVIGSVGKWDLIVFIEKGQPNMLTLQNALD